MNLHRSFLRRRTVWSDTGGISNNGFKVELATFKLVYSEDRRTLTLPVELLQGKTADYNIGTALIQHWDNSSEHFGDDQILTIKRNIFAALDYMGTRYSNLP